MTSDFFLILLPLNALEEIWQALGSNESLQYKANEEKKLSPLAWREEFN